MGVRIFCDRCGLEMFPEEIVVRHSVELCAACKTDYDKFVLNTEDVVATGKHTVEVKPPKP